MGVDDVASSIRQALPARAAHPAERAESPQASASFRPALFAVEAASAETVADADTPSSRGLHSSAFWFNVSTFCWTLCIYG
jgi:hypothetical protein